MCAGVCWCDCHTFVHRGVKLSLEYAIPLSSSSRSHVGTHIKYSNNTKQGGGAYPSTTTRTDTTSEEGTLLTLDTHFTPNKHKHTYTHIHTRTRDWTSSSLDQRLRHSRLKTLLSQRENRHNTCTPPTRNCTHQPTSPQPQAYVHTNLTIHDNSLVSYARSHILRLPHGSTSSPRLLSWEWPTTINRVYSSTPPQHCPQPPRPSHSLHHPRFELSLVARPAPTTGVWDPAHNLVSNCSSHSFNTNWQHAGDPDAIDEAKDTLCEMQTRSCLAPGAWCTRPSLVHAGQEGVMSWFVACRARGHTSLHSG